MCTQLNALGVDFGRTPISRVLEKLIAGGGHTGGTPSAGWQGVPGGRHRVVIAPLSSVNWTVLTGKKEIEVRWKAPGAVMRELVRLSAGWVLISWNHRIV